jgi:hypothetical protein
VAPREPCAFCGGTGTADADLNFILARLRCRDDLRWIGRSSDALVDAAMTGVAPYARPYDGWDLGRCLVTRAVAPPHLHERMDAILAEWTALIEREKPYHGIDAAREMASKETPAVRAHLRHLRHEATGADAGPPPTEPGPEPKAEAS